LESCHAYKDRRHVSRTDAEREIDLDEVRASLQVAISREHGLASWLRELPTQSRIGVALLAVGLTVLVPRVFVHVDGVSRWGASVAAPASICATILLALLWSALRPLQLPRIPQLDFVLIGAGLVAPFGLVDLAPGGACGLLRHLGYCFFIGTAVGWGLLWLLRALDRGDHQDRTVVWLAVGVAGLATNLALQFDCPETGAMHRLACHATIGVSLGLQYLLVVRLRERRARARTGG